MGPATDLRAEVAVWETALAEIEFATFIEDVSVRGCGELNTLAALAEVALSCCRLAVVLRSWGLPNIRWWPLDLYLILHVLAEGRHQSLLELLSLCISQ